jgi:hypothetical protein
LLDAPVAMQPGAAPGNPKHLKMTKFWRKPFLIRFAMAGGATSGSGSMITTGAIGSDDD